MIEINIRREKQIRGAIIGTLSVKDLGIICYTLERGWNNNAPSISCIPAGKYLMERTESFKFGKTFEVCKVPDRTHILIHPGNTIGDTEGCILVGHKVGELNGQPALLHSRKAFRRLMTILEPQNTYSLMITDAIRETC